MKFSDVREEIISKLNDPEKLKKLKIDESVALVEGFVNMPLTHNLDELVIGGPAASMIMLLGESGRVYFISFKTLDIR